MLGRRSLAAVLVAAVLAILGWYFPGSHQTSRDSGQDANRQHASRESGRNPDRNAGREGNRESNRNGNRDADRQDTPRDAAPAKSVSYTLAGAVSAVSDGDTVAFQAADGKHRIRLDSVDAPEIGHGEDQPGQPFGREARDHLAAWISGKALKAECYGRDQYGRDLCDLVAADGASANREMVRAGYAWAYTAAHGKYLRDQNLPALQEEASRARRGLWQTPAGAAAPTRPWQWRYDCWKQRQC
jgi:endonuclease YncB( thermonuclease family)